MKVFIGYDSREKVAYDVCKHSIEKRTSGPVEVIPLIQDQLREEGLYTRPIDTMGSTEFTFTRFLVPHLMNYDGWAIFADCDFLWLSDVKEIFDQADPKYAVQCVQHDYTPQETSKMDGQVQYQYPRKNWSSMVLWNCGHIYNRKVSAEIVNQESGAFLHRFQWLPDDLIGSIDYKYNWLDGWYNRADGEAKVVHHTRGGPFMRDWKNVDYADEWRAEFKDMTGRDFTDNDLID